MTKVGTGYISSSSSSSYPSNKPLACKQFVSLRTCPAEHANIFASAESRSTVQPKPNSKQSMAAANGTCQLPSWQPSLSTRIRIIRQTFCMVTVLRERGHHHVRQIGRQVGFACTRQQQLPTASSYLSFSTLCRSMLIAKESAQSKRIHWQMKLSGHHLRHQQNIQTSEVKGKGTNTDTTHQLKESRLCNQVCKKIIYTIKNSNTERGLGNNNQIEANLWTSTSSVKMD